VIEKKKKLRTEKHEKVKGKEGKMMIVMIKEIEGKKKHDKNVQKE